MVLSSLHSAIFACPGSGVHYCCSASNLGELFMGIVTALLRVVFLISSDQ